jgi:hypothetical protein
LYHSYNDQPKSSFQNFFEFLKSDSKNLKTDLRNLFNKSSIEKLLKTYYSVLHNENVLNNLKTSGVVFTEQLAKEIASSGYYIWPQYNSKENQSFYFSDFYRIDDEISNIKFMLLNNIKGPENDGKIDGLYSPVYNSNIKDFTIPEFESFIKALIACAYLVQNNQQDYQSDTMHAMRNISLKIMYCEDHGFDFPMWFKFNGNMVIIDPVKMTINKNPEIYDGAYITSLSVVSNCNN